MLAMNKTVDSIICAAGHTKPTFLRCLHTKGNQCRKLIGTMPMDRKVRDLFELSSFLWTYALGDQRL